MTSRDSELLRHVLRQLVIWGVGAFCLMWLLVADVLIARLEPGPRALQLRELRYEAGLIHQLVEPRSGPGFQAAWTASIARDGALVCAGSGVGEYAPRIEALRMTPDQWVGAPCGPLVPGAEYRASASWQWLDERGSPGAIVAVFTFVASHGPVSGL